MCVNVWSQLSMSMFVCFFIIILTFTRYFKRDTCSGKACEQLQTLPTFEPRRRLSLCICVCVYVLCCYGLFYMVCVPNVETSNNRYHRISHIYAWNGITKDGRSDCTHSFNEIANLSSTWIDMQIFLMHIKVISSK